MGWLIQRRCGINAKTKLSGRFGDLPVILSEFGGYSCKLPDHAFNLDKTYGYKTCADPEALQKDFFF